MPVNLARKGDTWYRVHDYGDRIYLDKSQVMRSTPAGVWIGYPGAPKKYWRFVLLYANKRYACPTIPEAVESFIARKQRQIKLLTNQLDRTQTALKTVQEKTAQGVLPPYPQQVRAALPGFFSREGFD